MRDTNWATQWSLTYRSGVLRRMRQSLRDVNQIDQRLVRRSAELPRTSADRGLRALGNSANHGLLWFGVAGILALRRGARRRAAFRAIVAIAGASTSANLVAKRLFPRRRPAAELVPTHRRLVRRPTSSSFPSGHAASAAAVTTAVAIEHPVAGAVLAPIAGAVAYSRVHTGVHWPSDVAAGALLGIATGLATQWWWPVGKEEPAQVRDHHDLPQLGDGTGLLIVINRGSGLNGALSTSTIGARWPLATIAYTGRDQNLVEQMNAVVTPQGQTEPPSALGVAGGDGTVAAAAAVAATRQLPLLVIPAGTLNHFARDIGIDNIDDVHAATRTGRGVEVDLSTVRVDGDEPRWFVNTASLGGYPDMVRLREKLEKRWSKWPATVIALMRVLARSAPLRLTFHGETHLVWMLFVGNGRYRPNGFGPTRRPRLDTGLMDVRYIRADPRFSRLRFVVAALTGALHRSHTYRHLEISDLEVQVVGNPVAIATDGEVGPLGTTFQFHAEPAALRVYR
jgi:diacylglycerol kinase family enzyme/membrane-associated phospholipid phosphatase